MNTFFQKNKHIIIPLLLSGIIIFIYYLYSPHWLINPLANITCYFTSVCFVLFLFRLILSNIKHTEKPKVIKETDISKNISGLVVCAILVSVFCGSVFKDLIGYHRLDYEEKGDSYKYYITVENEYGKTYTATADVNVSTYGDYSRAYFFDSLYFKNTGTVQLSDYVVFTKAGQKSGGTDSNGKSWSITLIDTPAADYTPKHLDFWSVSKFVFLLILFPSAYLFCYFLQEHDKRLIERYSNKQ